MAGFKQGGIEFKKKSVIGNPTTAEHIIVYWNDINDLIIKTSTGEDVIATESLVASISGNLQTQIDNLDLNYATDASVYAISAGLQSQVTNNDLDISGLRTDVNTISADLANLDLNYATDTQLIALSGELLPQIQSNDLDISGLRVDVVSVSGQVLTNDLDISGLRTDVNTISGDLDELETQFANLDATYATDTSLVSISGNLQAQIDTLASSWISLVNGWTIEPTLNASISGGDVYNYTYGSTLYYRFVPEPYDSTQDIFYSGFDGTNLTTSIAIRGNTI